MFGDIVKMTQASAQTHDEAEVLEALGIDLIAIADLDIDEIRAGAPNSFVTGSQTMVQYTTEDDALAAAICVAEKGADAIHTPRGLKTVERLAGEGLSVQGHLGLMLSLRRAMAAERKKALTGFRDAVISGAFPDDAQSVPMAPGEHERLVEALGKWRPLHQ